MNINDAIKKQAESVVEAAQRLSESAQRQPADKVLYADWSTVYWRLDNLKKMLRDRDAGKREW